ncbi:MAG: hypothetical protein ACQERN_12670 [Thermodesulfobacteriota bacterium]
MIPVFFPFTFIPEETAHAFYRRFGRFAVCQPVKGQAPELLADLSDQGVIELRLPVLGDEARITSLCRAFTEWGAMHGSDAAWMKELAQSGFYNEAFSAEIRSEILKSGQAEPPEKSDPVINARIFLQLAQQYDIREAEIAQNLKSADLAAENLFEQLKGAGQFDQRNRLAGPQAVVEDPGAYMPGIRMTAWSMLAGFDPTCFGAFLTHSPAIVEQVAEQFPSLAHLDTQAGLPEGGLLPAVSRKLADAGGQPDAVSLALTAMDWSGDDGYVIETHVISDCDPETFVAACADSPAIGRKPSDPIQPTLLFCLVPRA